MKTLIDTMRKETKCYESKHFAFWWGWGFELSFAICGYFDNRPQIRISLFFFHLIIKLPFKNKWTNECDVLRWGIAYHGQIFWVYLGGKGNDHGGSKWWTMWMPWSFQLVRTSYLRKDGSWEHSFRGDKRLLYREEWKSQWWSETHPYTYVLKSGEVQKREATITVEEREWRWHWFKWLPFPKKVSTTIAVRFNDEVGERTGSWKGGTIECSYNIKKGENPLACLRRMERERIFN